MKNLVLERGEYFNCAQESVRTELNNLFGKKFENLEEITENLKGIFPSVYIPKEISVKVDKLPHQITEYPVYGLVLDDFEPEEVARIRLV